MTFSWFSPGADDELEQSLWPREGGVRRSIDGDVVAELLAQPGLDPGALPPRNSLPDDE